MVFWNRAMGHEHSQSSQSAEIPTKDTPSAAHSYAQRGTAVATACFEARRFVTTDPSRGYIKYSGTIPGVSQTIYSE
ncbi:hypothetical protein AB1N83_000043 [Pleurotus pulmonarius]